MPTQNEAIDSLRQPQSEDFRSNPRGASERFRLSGAILPIARNTFRESIRDKVLYNLILFALVMIVSSIALSQLTLGHEKKIIIDLGLTSISVFGTLIAVFIGIGLVYKEMDKRTIYALLAKPVGRSQFILGKYLGLILTLLVNVAVMTLGLASALLYHGQNTYLEFIRLLPAVYLSFLSMALTTALALVFSTFSTPALSALFTLFFWGIGHFNRDLLDFGRLSKSRAMESLCEVFYYALPNLGNFAVIDGRNIIAGAAYSQPVSAWAVVWVSIYAVLYCSVLLWIAILIFSRRDFK